jgi:ABC-2 type transport system ATP-binding protein
MSAVVIAASGLSRAFGKLHALTRVTFELHAGAICGLIGPNGAGKTTLLRILAGLDEPDEGQRFIDGVDVAMDPHAARSRFGYVPDFAALYDGLTVREMVRFFGRAQGVPRQRLEEAVDGVLTAAGLLPVAHRAAASLSRGMSQRACVACAIVHDPAVLILDEPASGLDPRARIELRELLKALRTQGKTIFISSHILSELADVVDNVLIIERGVVRASGALDSALADVKGQHETHVRLEFAEGAELAEALLRSHSLVQSVSSLGGGLEVVLRTPDGAPAGAAEVAALVKALVETHATPSAVIPRRPSLESLFMSVTRGELQ